MAIAKNKHSAKAKHSTKDKHSAEVDERLLIQRAKEDPEAFGEIYALYIDRIYNYIYYRTSNVEDAEDLTSRVFQRAMKHIPKYEDKGIPFSAWLYRIARNLVLNWHRDNGKRTMVALDDIVHTHQGEGSPEGLMQLVENEQGLLVAVRTLPQDRQDLLVYKFLHGLSNAEIGAIMDRSEGAIKSLYHRTLIQLREEMREEIAERENRPKRPNIISRFWPRNQKNIEA